jgi:hypothetical protein
MLVFFAGTYSILENNIINNTALHDKLQFTNCVQFCSAYDKQRSTKYTHKIKDRVTRTQQKPGCELRCSTRVSSSCSTSVTRRVNLVT